MPTARRGVVKNGRAAVGSAGRAQAFSSAGSCPGCCGSSACGCCDQFNPGLCGLLSCAVPPRVRQRFVLSGRVRARIVSTGAEQINDFSVDYEHTFPTVALPACTAADTNSAFVNVGQGVELDPHYFYDTRRVSTSFSYTPESCVAYALVQSGSSSFSGSIAQAVGGFRVWSDPADIPGSFGSLRGVIGGSSPVGFIDLHGRTRQFVVRFSSPGLGCTGSPGTVTAGIAFTPDEPCVNQWTVSGSWNGQWGASSQNTRVFTNGSYAVTTTIDTNPLTPCASAGLADGEDDGEEPVPL